MDKLAPKLIRRAAKREYIAIIIDPIYKVITGDENSADQMAHFCNQFDKVCTELGCAVIYCHHHSKGAQGGKRSMDRASGSGVFARDPDALLDLIELEITDNLLTEEKNKAACKVLYDELILHGYSDISQDEAVSVKALRELAQKHLTAEVLAQADKDIAAAEKHAETRTAWRIEGTLREFPKFPPVNVWFDYPIHRMDMVGVLKDTNAEGDIPAWQKVAEKRKEQAKKQNDGNKAKFENAVLLANMGEPPDVDTLANYLSVSERTVRRWASKFGYDVDRKTRIVTKKNDGGTSE